MLEYVFRTVNHCYQRIMIGLRTKGKGLVRLGALVLLGAVLAASAQEASQALGSAATAKAVGTIKSISGNNLAITNDAGAPVTIVIQDSTRMVRPAPGAKDLKGATSTTLQELQSGDRVVVRGRTGDDGKSVLASFVLVIKAGDLAAKQQQEREDWQKRGIGGLVTAVDPGTGTITVSNSSMSGSKSTTIHVSKDTIVRRYAPNSVNFDDATPGTVDQIKVGDQLRARDDER
jgi:hypothetical protein